MQELSFTLFDQLVVCRFDVESSDEPAAMIVTPEEYQETIEGMSDGEQDGRGCRMAVGAFTPIGVSMALESAGITVTGLTEATSDDLDGNHSEESDSDMFESVPAHVRRHNALLNLLNR